MKTQIVTVWKALLRGEEKHIHDSEANIWEALENNSCWYKPEEKKEWKVFSEDMNLPVIEGELSDDHIHWECPFCKDTHHSDQYSDLSPQIWYCDRGLGIVLVQWNEIEPGESGQLRSLRSLRATS